MTAGSHAFRRFRDTYLRNYTATPDGLIKFWLGHAGADMSDLYDKIRRDTVFRRQAAEKAHFGFTLSVEIGVIAPIAPKSTETPDVQLSAIA